VLRQKTTYLLRAERHHPVDALLQSREHGPEAGIGRLGTTPVQVKLDNHKTHTFTYRLEGYKEASCTLTRGTGGGWVIADVLLGLVPVVIDAATNSWSQTKGSHCSGNMERLTGPAMAYAPEPTATSQQVAAEPAPEPTTSNPVASLQVTSTPPEPPVAADPADDATRQWRRTVVQDMTRVGVVAFVEQGPPGVLRVAIGQNFYSESTKQYYFRQLGSAYASWSDPGTPLVVELWDQGQKFGEYANDVFLMGPRYSTPRGCATDGQGLCHGLGGAATPKPQVTPPPTPSTAAPVLPPARSAPVNSSPTSSHALNHDGFHFGLGLGGGSAGLSCDGCDLSRETALSGYLSFAGSLGNNTLIGIESTGWTKDDSGDRAEIYSLMGTVTGYLNESSGLFLNTGLGLIAYHEGASFGSLSANSFVSGRLGYEAPPAAGSP
jgi:hypothetical protein